MAGCRRTPAGSVRALSFDIATILIVLAGAALAGFTTGFAGFGTALVASGLWFHALPPAMVPPLAALASVAGQLVGAIMGRKDFSLKRAVPLIAGGVFGVPVGVAALSIVSPLVLRSLVGLFLVAYALFQLGGWAELPYQVTWGGRKADAAVGLAGGVLGGFRRPVGGAAADLAAASRAAGTESSAPRMSRSTW